jgi:peroxiredoxin
MLWAAAGPAEARHLSALGAVELREPLVAPEFTLPAVSGAATDLRQFRGRLVLLTFWATWCLPCVEEMPGLERLHREFSGQGLAILAVSIDVQGAEVVAPFWRKTGHTYSVLLDPRQHVATRYGAWALPTAFLIDRAGRVVARIQGPRQWDSEAVRSTVAALVR